MAEDCRGWLHKLSGGKAEGTAWGRRYGVLIGATLFYYPSEAAAAAEVQPGAVHLGGVSLGMRELTTGAKGVLRYEWAVNHPASGDVLVLAADSRSDRDRWMDAMRAASSGGGDGGGKPSVATPSAEAGGVEEGTAGLAADLAAAEAKADATAEQTAALQAEVSAARLALSTRRALFHWRARRQRQCFETLVAARREATAGGA